MNVKLLFPLRSYRITDTKQTTFKNVLITRLVILNAINKLYNILPFNY